MFTILRIVAGIFFGLIAILNFFTNETFSGETIVCAVLSVVLLLGPFFLSLSSRVKQNMNARLHACSCADERTGLSCSNPVRYAVSLIALDTKKLYENGMQGGDGVPMSYAVCEEHHPHIGKGDSRCARWWADNTEKKGLTIHLIEILD